MDEEKMLKLFTAVHGPIKGACYKELVYDDDNNLTGVAVMKDGNLCWYASALELLFEYITKDM